jgi:signal transduction histidine kinase
MLDDREIRELARPFRRLAPDRTGSEGGTGLGLSIVAAIAATHHGTLDLHARGRGGLRVIITLPAADQTVMTGLPS